MEELKEREDEEEESPRGCEIVLKPSIVEGETLTVSVRMLCVHNYPSDVSACC